jgi:hypothetical protein
LRRVTAPTKPTGQRIRSTPIREDRGFSWTEDAILIFIELIGAKLLMMNRSENPGLANRGLLLLVFLLAILSLCLFLIPAFVIRPFRHQSQNALGLAIAVKRIAPALTVVALTGVVALGWQLWRSSSRLCQTGIVIALALSAASAVMVRQNYFEWMFHPIKTAGFVPAGDIHLGDKEMVMAV